MVVNGHMINHDSLGFPLNNGDEVFLLLAVGGG
ncbi:MoaD/ThiS family protein [Chloroflexota bacterium]